MKKEMQVGIIGYGFMGHWHADHMPQTKGIMVTAVCDIDERKRKEAFEKGYHSYVDYRDLLQDKLVNTVLISVPNHLHKEMVIEAAKAGKNIICEKPAALNVQEFDEMVQVTRECKVQFEVHQNRRFDADFKCIKEALNNRTLGRVFTIGSRFFGGNGLVHDWHRLPEYGGGMIYDWGVHLIDQMLDLNLGKVVSVFANVHNVINPKVDDYFNATFQFDSGLSYVIEIGTYLLYPLPRWYVAGDTGTLVIKSMLDDAELYRSGSHVKKLPDSILETKAGPTRAMAKRAEEELIKQVLPTGKPKWQMFYENYLASFNGEAELEVTNTQVREVLQLMEAVRLSGRKHASVDVR